MKIVIQCAAKKNPDAGYMKDNNGMDVMFVAAPELIETNKYYVYQTPETISKDGLSWRLKLLQYNKDRTVSRQSI